MTETPVAMPESEQDQVLELQLLLKRGSPALLGPDDERIELPPSVYSILKDVVNALQHGKGILVLKRDQEFTTQSAAAFLGVSRPHIIKLIQSEELPCHKTGSHRRIYLNDLLEFAKRRDAERKRIINQLSKEASESGLYDSAEIPEGGNDE